MTDAMKLVTPTVGRLAFKPPQISVLPICGGLRAARPTGKDLT